MAMQKRTKYIMASAVLASAVALSVRGCKNEVEIQSASQPCEGGVKTELIAHQTPSNLTYATDKYSEFDLRTDDYRLFIRTGKDIVFPHNATHGRWYEAQEHGPVIIASDKDNPYTLVNHWGLSSKEWCFTGIGRPIFTREMSSKER